MENFFSPFALSKATPRAVWASMIPLISSRNWGMKRIAVERVNAYWYGTCSTCTRELVRSVTLVTASTRASGIQTITSRITTLPAVSRP